MKKILVLVCCIISCEYIHAAKKSEQQIVARTEKGIVTLFKKGPKHTGKILYETWGFHEKNYEISLKDIDKKALTKVEKKLLEQFSDVVISKYTPNCYYVINQKQEIGLYALTGEEIVPPLPGHVRTIRSGHSIMLGDDLDDETWLKKASNVILKSSGTGAGHFQAVVDRHSLQAVIPAGRYHDIQLTHKGATLWYYVARLDNNGDLRWGVCDKQGNEVLPCEYISVYKEARKIGIRTGGTHVGGKFIGSNDRTMNEVENLVENKIQLAEKRRERWAAGLLAAGIVMQSIGEATSIGTGNYGNESTIATSLGSSNISNGNYQQGYASWERKAEQHYHSLTNLGVRVSSTSNGKSSESGTSGGSGHISTSNYSQMKRALREAQNEMKKIRTAAKRAGIEIKQSKWETATVEY